VKWAWPSLVAALAVLAVLLAVADSVWLRDWLPQPTPRVRPLPRFGGLPPGRGFIGLAPGRPQLPLTEGLFSFWWFFSTGVAFVLAGLAALVLFPARARVAVERLESPGGLVAAVVAGIASALLLAGALFVLRVTFFLLPLVPVVLALAAMGALFGVACMGLFVARFARRRLGGANPILLAFTGLLAIFDLALIPFAGWVALAVFVVAGLGLAVITRLGSAPGWAVEELNW